MEYHPDKSHHVLPRVKTLLREMWDAAPGTFEQKFKALVTQAQEKTTELQKHVAHIRDDKAELLDNNAVLELLSWLQGPGWIAMEVLLEEQQEDEWSYGRLCTNPQFISVARYEEQVLMRGMPSGEVNTARILRYCISAYEKNGRKLYVVSPGLAWEMRNIQLRNMPSELLRLPFNALYLTAPKELKVYNQHTGWHDLEGLYVVADNAAVPRTWRLVMTGGPNEQSTHPKDDSLFHYFVKLADGKTIEQCIEDTLNDVVKDGAFSRSIDGKKIYNAPKTQEQADIFNLMRDHLKAAFSYVVNVMLYATHPDAEEEAFNASPEFRALYRRARKAKGKKRKDLFARAKACKGPEYIKLGASVTVSRELRDAVESSKGKGTKHSVRTYVSAHWQHFWTGPRDGERTRIYKLKRAHWKGAKDLPVSERTHHVK